MSPIKTIHHTLISLTLCTITKASEIRDFQIDYLEDKARTINVTYDHGKSVRIPDAYEEKGDNFVGYIWS